MKIDHIRTFLEISNCGNFNRAAENLNVTQSTVSARIKAMEDRFGRVLFKRGHSGVELTSALSPVCAQYPAFVAAGPAAHIPAGEF
jgi:DNA-binding transcriptional LysR family regulator